VRLRHAQLPEEARDLDKELRALLKEKEAAVRCASLDSVHTVNIKYVTRFGFTEKKVQDGCRLPFSRPQCRFAKAASGSGDQALPEDKVHDVNRELP